MIDFNKATIDKHNANEYYARLISEDDIPTIMDIIDGMDITSLKLVLKRFVLSKEIEW